MAQGMTDTNKAAALAASLHERGSNLVSHPVANSTVGDTEESGALMLEAAATLRALAARVDALEGAVAAERERCAALCDDISDEYQHRECHRFPELKTDAQAGAEHCADAIRRLPPHPAEQEPT